MSDLGTMPAGGAMDELIDRAIFRRDRNEHPPYSTEIEAAWSVAEQLGVCVDLTIVCGDLGKRYFARIYPRDDVQIQVEAEMMPLAICRAALQFVERKSKNAR